MSVNLNSIDFKERSQKIKSVDDLSNLAKEFMKNMISSELDEHITNTSNIIKWLLLKNG